MQFTHKLFRFALFCLITLLLAILISLAILRFVVYPNINAYKSEIAQKISQSIGKQVSISQINTGWRNFSPQLVLQHINILDDQNRVALHLNRIDATVSWLSVPLVTPRLSALKIQSPEITIRRMADGNIAVAGFILNEGGKPDFANWLLNQNQFNINNAKITWLDETRQAQPLVFDKLDLKVKKSSWGKLLGRHNVELTAKPDFFETPLTLNGSFSGNDVEKLDRWHGKGTLKLPAHDLTRWKPWLDYPIALNSGQGESTIIFEFSNQSIQQLEAKLALKQLNITPANATQAIAADVLSANVYWQQRKDGYSLQTKQLTLQSNRADILKNADFKIVKSLQKNVPITEATLNVDALDLNALALLNTLPLPETVKKYWQGLAPRGQLKAVNFVGRGNLADFNLAKAEYRLSADLDNVSFTAFEQIPGFEQLSGRIEANQNRGTFKLITLGAMLDLKNVLRWPVPLTQLSGLVHWEKQGKNFVVGSSNLTMKNAHVGGNLDFSINFNEQNQGYIDLTGKFGQGDARFAKFYYPTILGETTLHWLDTSILKGRADDIHVRIKGKLADFPYVTADNKLDLNQGLFRVSANVTDAELEYGTSWPKIQDLSIQLLFEGKRMALISTKGRIFQNQIKQSKTSIAKLDADSPILQIDSIVNGNTQEMVHFVNMSPVKEVAQGFTDHLKTTGQGKLALHLAIPLRHLESAKYSGKYTIENASILAEPSLNLPELKPLSGTLEFTENSLLAPNIKTTLFDSPAQFTLKAGADKKLRVFAKGEVTDSALKKSIHHPIAAAFEGKTNWQAEIEVQKPMMQIKLHSNLAGMAIKLPVPFKKAKEIEMPLDFVRQQSSAQADQLEMSLAKLVQAKLVRSGNNFNAVTGAIAINAPLLPAKPNMIHLNAKFDQLNVDEWLRHAATFNEAADNQTNAQALPIQLTLDVGNLDIAGRQLHAFKANITPQDNGLTGAIDSKEMLGNIEWIHGTENKIIARLDHLTLTTEKQSNHSNHSNQEFNKSEITRYPAIDLIANKFQIGDKELGKLELNAFQKGKNWEINKLLISNKDSTLTGNGAWRNWTGAPATHLVFELKSSDLGKTMTRLGHANTIKKGELTMSGTLDWPGSPHEFKTINLDGKLNLDAKKGEILKVQPGVGRLLGLISLQSLPRRLSLDFKDLFSEGFAFDSISATAGLEGGVLRSRDFFMTGPAAEAKIKGEVNLNKETQNLKVKVTPHVTDSVALAALAGGPIVGVAAFVAQKILKDPLNKIASSEYLIAGTWDNPTEQESAPANNPVSNSTLEK